MAVSSPQTDSEWLVACRLRVAEAEQHLHDVQDVASYFDGAARQMQCHEVTLGAAVRATLTLPIGALRVQRRLAATQAEVAVLRHTLDEWQSEARSDLQDASDQLSRCRAGLRVVP
jgi:hypothetical protein